MITIVNEKRPISTRQAEIEFDGHWLLLDKRDFRPKDLGYVVAYGNDSDEDRDVLKRMNLEKYDGRTLLMKGWVQKDDVLDSGIIDIV